MKEITWRPKRRGKIYCAPACGRECTFSEYTQAVNSAKALVRKMKTKGWKPHVWENLGWHYKIVRGRVSIYAYKHMKATTYSPTLATEDGGIGTPMDWSIRKSFKNPNAAARAQLKHMRKVHANVTRSLSDAVEAVGDVA